MHNIEDYQDLKYFQAEGSVMIGWSTTPDGKRQFEGIHFAGFDESFAEIIQSNQSDDNDIKYNLLVPAFQLENLSEEEQTNLILNNIQNEIWNWKEPYNFPLIIKEQLF